MIFQYRDDRPELASGVKVFPGAVVAGAVRCDEFVNIWYNAVVRGDMAPVTIGRNTNIQDNAVIHTNTGLPTLIGANVTVGHGAIIHAATIGDDALIGMGAVILDGAIVETQALVAAGCVVPPGKTIPAGMLAVGNPAKVVRPLTPAEIEANRQNAATYVKMANAYE